MMSTIQTPEYALPIRNQSTTSLQTIVPIVDNSPLNSSNTCSSKDMISANGLFDDWLDDLYDINGTIDQDFGVLSPRTKPTGL